MVEKVLLRSFSDGKDFSVIVVDSRPMLEGFHHSCFNYKFTFR